MCFSADSTQVVIQPVPYHGGTVVAWLGGGSTFDFTLLVNKHRDDLTFMYTYQEQDGMKLVGTVDWLVPELHRRGPFRVVLQVTRDSVGLIVEGKDYGRSELRGDLLWSVTPAGNALFGVGGMGVSSPGNTILSPYNGCILGKVVLRFGVLLSDHTSFETRLDPIDNIFAPTTTATTTETTTPSGHCTLVCPRVCILCISISL